MGLTKAQLEALNISSFPDNTSELITPEILRGYNSASIANTVNQDTYTTDSASFDSRINAITGSSTNTGSLVTTSSFNAYTQSLNSSVSQLNASSASQQVSINNLNTTTASLLIETQNLELFSASALTSISNLNQSSASQQVSINNLNAATSSYVTETESGSFLITASVAVNVITFTKGDNTTFDLAVVSSGSVIPGTITGSAQITALGFVSSSVTASSLVTASFDNGTRNLTFTKGDASTFAVNIPDVSGSAGTTIYEVVYTGENITKGDPLYISGSQGANPIVFKANASNPAKMPVTFIANETIAVANTTEAIVLGLIEGIDLTGYTAGQTIYVAEGGGYSINLPSGSNSVTQLLGVITKGGTGGKGLVLNPGPAQLPGLDTGKMWVGNGNNQPIEITTASFASSASFNTYTSSTDSRLNNIESTTASLLIETQNLELFSASALTSISNLNQSSASQQISIDALNLNSASVNTSITELNSATSSLFTSASLGLITASISGQTLTFSKGDGTTFGILIPDVSGSTINTASFATTGSNVFTGDQTMIDNAGNFFTISDASGSMMLVAKSYTSASAHISSSVNQVNLIWKQNDGAVDTIISGSGNIFANQSVVTAGFKRYIGGNFNTFSGVTSLPQISGSMGFSPSFATNYIAGAVTMRGPVSASAWSILQNNIIGTLNLGQTATLNAEKLTSGFGMSQNYIAGTVSVVANQSFLTGSATLFQQNNINGTATLNLSSSAVNFSNNTINDNGFILTNQYYSQSVGLGLPVVQKNTIAGTSNTIIISGALATGTVNQPNVIDNIIGGGSNIIYSDIANARVSGSLSYNNANRSIIYGQGLIVSASSFAGDLSSMGSAFFGRYNSIDGTKDLTGDTIFAVGTGNTAARKTGFLIDSGSNTFVEGTLNVSGAVSFTGSAPSILSSSFSGSLITNLTDIYTDVPEVKQIVTLTSASYAALASGSLTNPNTLYIVSGSTPSGGSTDTGSLMVTGSVAGNVLTFTKGDASTFSLTVATGSGGGGVTFPYSGSVEITGSVKVQPITLSVASSTASIDMNQSNYFILNLPTSSTTHIAFSNIIPGESINLLVSQSATAATGSIVFAPNIYFPGGNDYVATATGSAKDIVSFITFNNSEIYATNVKNLK